MKKLFKRIWAIYFYLVFAITFLVCYPLFALFLSNPKWYRAANRLRIIWARTFNFLSGIWNDVTHEVPLDKKATYIFCPNHSSYLDIPLIGLSIGNTKFHYMAKAELAKIPLFKIFFKTVDIEVDRTDPNKSALSLKEAEENLKNGWDLIIFPEGTTSKIMPKLMRFKNGPFKLGIATGVPIVPVTILDNWKMLPNDGKHRGYPGKTRVIFHEPILTEGMKESDVDSLRQQTQDVIQNSINSVWK